ncbi:MAG: ligase-associated DNA damage response exonuclease [Alphaproteobacteria bacterium]|nr:ligase-associated DNA damage response exonuclease [Alphaproteobacteria bacterium]
MTPLLEPKPGGLYCAEGDFFVDPVRAVKRAVITHGHSDHARAGHEQVLATAETIAIMEVRCGDDCAGIKQAARYGQTTTIGNVKVTLKPAGHILGSAQAVVERGAERIVVSGDYKRRRDPTCARFEPVECDVFISEATFGLPVFTHPPDTQEIAKLLHSIAVFPERAHLVGAYSLGKAQRIIALLREAGYDAPIFLHGAMVELCKLYERFGVRLGLLIPLTEAKNKIFSGSVVIAPPSVFGERWTRRLGDHVNSFASGWMRIRARARQQGIELPLIVSDHADWEELTATVEELRPRELWVTHGQEDALVHYSRSIGVPARPLSLKGYDETGEGEPETGTQATLFPLNANGGNGKDSGL